MLKPGCGLQRPVTLASSGFSPDYICLQAEFSLGARFSATLSQKQGLVTQVEGRGTLLLLPYGDSVS